MSPSTIDADASEAEVSEAVVGEELEAHEPPSVAATAPRVASLPRGMPVTHAVPAPLRPANAGLAPAASGKSSSSLAQMREFGSRALDHAQYQLRRLGSVTLGGIVALVAAITIFFSYNLPQGTAVSALQAQIAHAPAVAVTATPNGASLASLPPRSDAPDVVAKIYEEAKAAGVELPRGQYEYVPPRDGVAARYRLTFPVHATYPQIRGFLDRTLIALPAVAVEGLRIERKTVGDGSVDAEVKFAAYVRGEP